MITLFLIVLIGGAFAIAVLGSDMASSMSWQHRPKPPGLLAGPDASDATADDVEVAHSENQQHGSPGLMRDSKSERDGL